MRARRSPAYTAAIAAVAVGALGLSLSAGRANTTSAKNGTIVYALQAEGTKPDLYAVDPPSGRPDNLTSDDKSQAAPSFSPDGTEIVYASKLDQATELYTIPAAGGAPDQLTELPDLFKIDPVYTPDGSAIVFSANQGGFPGAAQLDLWTVGADGSGAKRLTHTRAEEASASFSPDGARIVFTVQPGSRQPGTGGPLDVFVAHADGSGARNLTARYDKGKPRIDSFDDPSFSPDGKRIIVSGDVERGGRFHSEIYVMKANGANLHRVVRLSESVRDPVYSPDGRQIAFVRDGPRKGLYTATADGKRVNRVAAGGAGDPHAPGVFQGDSPTWQPVSEPGS